MSSNHHEECYKPKNHTGNPYEIYSGINQIAVELRNQDNVAPGIFCQVPFAPNLKAMITIGYLTFVNTLYTGSDAAQ